MAEASMNFLTREGHKLRFPVAESLGEALKAAAEFRFPRNTEKLIERAWDLAPATAKNVTKGHASERTLQKALRAEGWDLWAEVGERLTGQSYSDHLSKKVEEAKHAAERLESSRVHVQAMEERARRLRSVVDRKDDLPRVHAPGRLRPALDGPRPYADGAPAEPSAALA